MKVPTKPIGCSLEAQTIIMNHSCKPEEYYTGDRRVLCIVNTRNGNRIYNTEKEKSFDDMCKRLGWK